MNRIYFTIGLPRSGKSTLGKLWADYQIDFDNRGRQKFFKQEGSAIPRRLLLSPDATRLALGHRFNWHVEPLVFANTQIMVKAAYMNGYDVFVDCTNTNEESVMKWLYIDVDAIPIVVNTNIGECKRRATESKQSDLHPVIDRMYDNMVNTYGNNFCMLDSVMEKFRNKVKKNASVGAIV